MYLGIRATFTLRSIFVIVLGKSAARVAFQEKITSRKKPRRFVLIVAVLVFGLLLPAVVAGLAFEIHTRYLLWKNYTGANRTIFMKNEDLGTGQLEQLRGEKIQDSPIGLFKANRQFFVWFIGGDNKVVFDRVSRTNNLGLLSDKSYDIEKKLDEFRILFLGDSMTGTTTMNYQWVDLVEDILGQDSQVTNLLGGKKVKTYNGGWPGAGFAHFAKTLTKLSQALKPDLVIVNYPESDYPRMEVPRNRAGKQVKGGFVSYYMGPEPKDTIHLNLICTEDVPVSLKEPECYQFWIMFGPEHLARNPEVIGRVVKTVLDDYLLGKTVFTLYPYGYYRWLGRNQTFDNYRNPEMFSMQVPEEDSMIANAGKHLDEMMQAEIPVWVTLMPLYQDMIPKNNEYRMTHKLMAKNGKYKIEIMRERLPLREVTAEEVYTWYNLPHDGHMSPKGGEIYANVMANFIKERLSEELPK